MACSASVPCAGSSTIHSAVFPFGNGIPEPARTETLVRVPRVRLRNEMVACPMMGVEIDGQYLKTVELDVSLGDPLPPRVDLVAAAVDAALEKILREGLDPVDADP